MTAEQIVAWERQLLAERDLTDLADVVELLRTLAWSARLGVVPAIPVERAFVWFEDIGEFGPAIDLLHQCALTAAAADRKAMCELLARLYAVVRKALLAEPHRPSDDELVWRYVCGEIGDVTACNVAGWTGHELLAQCRCRGLAPVQGHVPDERNSRLGTSH